MKLHVFTRYTKYSIRPNYAEPTEKIIHRDMLALEKQLADTHTDLVYSFDEFAAGVSQNINVSYMNINELTAPHHHDFYEVNVVLNGTLVEHIIGGEFYTLRAGDILIMHPDVIHSLYTFQKCRAINILLGSDVFEKMRLMLDVSLQNSVLDDIIDNRSFALFSTHGDEFAKMLCEDIYSWWRTKKSLRSGTGAELEADFAALMTLLSQKHNAIENTKYLTASETQIKHREVVRYIRDHYASVTVEEVSEVFGYSPSQVFRIVKKEAGNSFQGIIMAKRLLLSMHLLSATDYPISQIAEIVGLSCCAYFSRFFHAQVGYSPLEFRKAVRNGTYHHESEGKEKLLFAKERHKAE